MATLPNIPLDDWHLLFDAVMTRLREAAGQDATGVVLDCVHALEQLQATLRREQQRNQS